MHNISKFILTFFIAIPLVFAFGSQTVKQIDEIKNNTGTDIVLNPTDKVKINYFAGEKALQSTVDGELEESAVTNTELGFVSGVTSSIQTQIDSKAPLTRLINTTAPLQGGGDLTTDRTLSILQSGTAQDGYLSQTDWNTFNNKQNAITGTDGDLYYWNSGLSNLAIGTTNQILQVSALGFPDWADLPPSVSVTTKGDIQTYSTAPDRLPVGTDNQILSANSATATGLEWIDPPNTSPTTTQGDIIIRGATEDERLPIGTVDQILVSNGTTLAYQDLPVSLPDQTGHSGEYLRSNGTDADWQNVNDSVNDVKDNLLECASFEDCTFEGVITTSGTSDSAISARTSEVSAYNDSKLNLSATAASTLDYTYTKTASFDGKQMVAYCEIKTANTGVTFSAGADSVEAGSLSVSSGNTWRYYKIPFVGGATSQYFKVDHANAGETPDIDIDNCFIGKSSNEIRDLGQAHFVGRLTYNTASNCIWSNTSTTMASFAADTDCNSTTAIGNVSAPNTAIPAVKIPNARTDGYYRVSAQGFFYLNSGNNAEYQLSDGTNAGGYSVANSNVDSRIAGMIEHSFKFTTNGEKQIEIQSSVQGGESLIFSSALERKLEFTVHFYPDDTSTIVTQDTELTAKTANEFTGYIATSTGTISNTNFDIMSCSNAGVGVVNCTYNTGLFASTPSVQMTVSDGAGTCREVRTYSSSASGFSYNTLSSSGSPTNCQVAYEITRGTDYNKSATIVGKFENINSTDLLVVNANNNTGGTTGVYANDIEWSNEIRDNYNAWDGTKLTSPRDTCYDIKAAYRATVNGQSVMTVFINGFDSGIRQASDTAYIIQDYTFNDICVSKNDTISFRINLDRTLLPDTAYHRLVIQERPDYEAIVKNLSQEKEDCQTKYLSSTVTTDGAIADLQFNNLTVGKKYRIQTQLRVLLTVADAIALRNINGSQNPVCYPIAGDNSNGTSVRTVASNCYFTATDTTLTSLAESITSPNQIQGAGGVGFTYVTLCELPDSTIINSNKFD